MNKVDKIPHLEDLLLTPMQTQVPALLTEMIWNMQTGKNFTIKYDGSPSIVLGCDPEDGQFFVATKSLFNKTGPVLYKTLDEISDISNPGLRTTMSKVFCAYRDLPHKHIYQGDLMWTCDELENHGNHVKFRTNTLTYACYSLPAMSAMLESDVGVAFHTRYEGDTIKTLKVAEDALLEEVPRSKQAFAILPYLARNFQPLREVLGRQPRVTNYVLGGYDLQIDPEVLPRFKKFLSHGWILNANTFEAKFLGHLSEYYLEEIDDRKSNRGKMAVQERYRYAVEWVKEHSADMYRIYCDYEGLLILKSWLLYELNKLAIFPVVCAGQLASTDQEGFVYKYKDTLVKLVDKNGFTRANKLNSLNLRR